MGRGQKGFSIVELAVVMVVMGLLLGGLLQPLGQAIEHHRQRQAKGMLHTAAERIEAFAMINQRLPCPTGENNPLGNDYGMEDCSVVETEGPLPWRTLDMPETDPWGSPRYASNQSWAGYLRYRVDPALAKNQISKDDINDKELTIVVLDEQGRQLSNRGASPVAIICSYGKDKAANGENGSMEALPEATYQSAQLPHRDIDDQCVWISRLTLLHRMIQMQNPSP